MTMTTIEILKKARELISDEKHWTKGVYARTVHSTPCAPIAEQAFCWCSVGAIAKIEGLPCTTLGVQFSEQGSSAARLLATDHAPSWNDAPERTHAEVLQRFDEAIARLEAAG